MAFRPHASSAYPFPHLDSSGVVCLFGETRACCFCRRKACPQKSPAFCLLETPLSQTVVEPDTGRRATEAHSRRPGSQATFAPGALPPSQGAVAPGPEWGPRGEQHRPCSSVAGFQAGCPAWTHPGCRLCLVQGKGAFSSFGSGIIYRQRNAPFPVHPSESRDASVQPSKRPDLATTSTHAPPLRPLRSARPTPAAGGGSPPSVSGRQPTEWNRTVPGPRGPAGTRVWAQPCSLFAAQRRSPLAWPPAIRSPDTDILAVASFCLAKINGFSAQNRLHGPRLQPLAHGPLCADMWATMRIPGVVSEARAPRASCWGGCGTPTPARSFTWQVAVATGPPRIPALL